MAPAAMTCPVTGEMALVPAPAGRGLAQARGGPVRLAAAAGLVRYIPHPYLYGLSPWRDCLMKEKSAEIDPTVR